MSTPIEGDDTVGRVGRATIGSALVGAAVAFFVAGPRFAVSVVVGGAIMALNLLALSRILRATLAGPTEKPASPLWGLAYVGKLGLLFGGCYLLFDSGWVTILGVAVGFAALLPAIVLEGARASADEGPKAQ